MKLGWRRGRKAMGADTIGRCICLCHFLEPSGLATDSYEVFLFYNEMQKHAPVHINYMVQWLCKTYFMIIGLTQIVIWCPTSWIRSLVVPSTEAAFIFRKCHDLFQNPRDLTSDCQRPHAASLFATDLSNVIWVCRVIRTQVTAQLVTQPGPAVIFFLVWPHSKLAACKQILARVGRAYRVGKMAVTVWGGIPANAQWI